jgi:AraC family transcriptional regulator
VEESVKDTAVRSDPEALRDPGQFTSFLGSGLRTKPAVTSLEHGWSRVNVLQWDVDPSAGGVDPYVSSLHILTVRLGKPGFVHRIGDGGVSREQTYHGDFNLHTAGTRYGWHGDGAHSLIQLLLDPGLINDAAAECGLDPAAVELRDCVRASDPQIARFAGLFLREAREGKLGSRLYADSMATGLAVHLLRNWSSLSGPGVPRTQGLSPGQLRRVVGRMEECIDQPLSLKELAAEAGLSQFHFARCFRQATGMPPHRYLQQERGRDRPVRRLRQPGPLLRGLQADLLRLPDRPSQVLPPGRLIPLAFPRPA